MVRALHKFSIENNQHVSKNYLFFPFAEEFRSFRVDIPAASSGNFKNQHFHLLLTVQNVVTHLSHVSLPFWATFGEIYLAKFRSVLVLYVRNSCHTCVMVFIRSQFFGKLCATLSVIFFRFIEFRFSFFSSSLHSSRIVTNHSPPFPSIVPQFLEVPGFSFCKFSG